MANTTLTPEQVKLINETKEVLGQLEYYFTKLESIQDRWRVLRYETKESKIAGRVENVAEMLDHLCWNAADGAKWDITITSIEVDKLIKAISGQPIDDECYNC